MGIEGRAKGEGQLRVEERARDKGQGAKECREACESKGDEVQTLAEWRSNT